MIRIRIEKVEQIEVADGQQPRDKTTLLLEQNLPDERFGPSQMWMILTSLNQPPQSTTRNSAKILDVGNAAELERFKRSDPEKYKKLINGEL